MFSPIHGFPGRRLRFTRRTLPRPIVDGYRLVTWSYLGERSSAFEHTQAQPSDPSYLFQRQRVPQVRPIVTSIPKYAESRSHVTHHVLAIYGLGASPQIIEDAYETHDYLKPAFESPDPITEKNFAEHLGDER